MPEQRTERTKSPPVIPSQVGWIFVALYLLTGVLNVLFPGRGLLMAGTGVNLIFGILLSLVVVGWKRTILFNIIAFVVVAVIEDLSIYTGFPFGVFTHFTEGPRILAVPVVVCLGYFHYAMIGWVLADLILPRGGNNSESLRRWGRICLGAFVASSIDLIQDPIGVMIEERWVFPAGGGLFGVPFTNNVGWFVTVFITIALWELVLARGALPRADSTARLYFSQWHLIDAVLLGAQIVPLLLSFLFLESVPLTDILGKTWYSGDIYEALSLIALHTVLLFMTLGILCYRACRLSGGHAR